jgi:hypothetical protein
MVIRRVGVWSVAKLYGGMLAAMGLLFGLILALVSLLGVGLASAAQSNGNFPGGPLISAMFGVGAVIVLPIFYGVLGIVTGALSAALYNVFSGIFGGIEVEAS